MPEKKTPPTHGDDGHAIFLGRSTDVHQNPICRTCGKGLDDKEFKALQDAGLVVC